MEMMKKSTCKIVINQDFPDGVAREIIFSGTKEQVEAAKVLVSAVIVHGPIILANVEVLNQATVAATAITNPPTSTTSGVLHARQAGKAQATAQLVRSVGVANAAVRVVVRMCIYEKKHVCVYVFIYIYKCIDIRIHIIHLFTFTFIYE